MNRIEDGSLDDSYQVCILAPTGKDSVLLQKVLEESSIPSESVSTGEALAVQLLSYGAVVIAEESLTVSAVESLSSALRKQAPWSDLPMIILTSSGENTRRVLSFMKSFGDLANLSLLERPLRPITLITAVQGALRARKRQYQIRELLTQQVEATRVRDEFISIASHELRTPLTSLKLLIQLNQRSFKKDPASLLTEAKVSKLIHFTDDQVSRLTRLVEDMLDVSKIGSGKFLVRKSPVDFSRLIRDALDRLAEELKSARCVCTVELPETLVISLDQDRIEQVVTNLLTNIVKYAPGTHVFIQLRADDRVAVLEVSDDGPGIPLEKQVTVFDRFERATSSKNISGLGLGLYICRQIVHLHSGAIHLQSAPGKGTCFTVSLPLS